MIRPGPTDAERLADLLAVARDRDRAAFTRLYGHFAPRIKAYMMRQGTAAARAEDLAQEAMLSVWRKAHLFDPTRAAVSTWVFAIARNQRIDALRRETHPECAIEDAGDVVDPAARPDTLAEHGQHGRLLRAAIADLPKEQAQVVELSFYADKAHGDIAAHLGLPLGTVKSRLRIAMGRIRQSLGDDA